MRWRQAWEEKHHTHHTHKHWWGQSYISSRHGAEITCIKCNGSHSSHCLLRKSGPMHAPPPPKTYGSLSVWGALHRLESSLTSSSALRKQIGWKCSVFVTGWRVACFFPEPSCHSQIWGIDASGPTRSANKCGGTAAPWARTDSYPDKQIDEQSAPFHYRAEKLTTSTSGSGTAAAERPEGEEERHNMNFKFTGEQTLRLASYWLRRSWAETISVLMPNSQPLSLLKISDIALKSDLSSVWSFAPSARWNF